MPRGFGPFFGSEPEDGGGSGGGGYADGSGPEGGDSS